MPLEAGGRAARAMPERLERTPQGKREAIWSQHLASDLLRHVKWVAAFLKLTRQKFNIT